MSDIPKSPAYDIVRQIDLRGADSGGCCILLKPGANQEAFLPDLADEFRVQLNSEPREVDAASMNLDHLRESLQKPSHDVVLVKGLEAWSDDALLELDISRSAIERPGFVILWLPLAGLVRLFQRAPNIRSWVGGSIFGVRRDRGLMSAEERRARLSDLSEHYHLEDNEVIRMAQSGTLPPDPQFVEWLILLERQDLAK